MGFRAQRPAPVRAKEAARLAPQAKPRTTRADHKKRPGVTPAFPIPMIIAVLPCKRSHAISGLFTSLENVRGNNSVAATRIGNYADMNRPSMPCCINVTDRTGAGAVKIATRVSFLIRNRTSSDDHKGFTCQKPQMFVPAAPTSIAGLDNCQ